MNPQNDHDMKESQVSLKRRSLLNRIWVFLAAVAMAQFGWLGLSFMNSRKDRRQLSPKKAVVTAGLIQNFRPESVTAITEGQFYLACLADGSFLALSRTCTHLGCSLPWDEETRKFACPCHGSSFDLTGEVLTGPALRPLDFYPVRIENGIVKVDVSSPQKRDRFDTTQTTRL